MRLTATRFELRRYSDVAAFHAHDHHQIVLPLRGTLDMVVDDRAHGVRDCCAAVIPAGQTHGFAGSDDNAFLILDTPADTQQDENASRALWSLAADQPYMQFDEALRGFCETLSHDRRTLNGPSVRTAVAGAIVIEAMERSMGFVSPSYSKPLAKAVAFIDAQYSDLLAVSEVAREAGISESRLYAAFERELGISPKRYIARRRLERAAQLLESGHASIAEIAGHVGYGDQSAFSRAFQREWGESPSRYRKARKMRDSA